jgi:uncharacterized membrane protein
MSKTTYLFAIVYFSFVFIADLVHFGFWQQLGPEVVTMQSYLSWSTISAVTGLIAFSFILRYFLVKGWKFVFLSALVGWALAILLSIFQYTRLVKVQTQPSVYYNVSLISYWLCMLIVGVNIIAASRKNEKSLKWSGIIIAFTSLSLLLLSLPAMAGRPSQVYNNISIIMHHLSGTVWLLFIWIFVKEIRQHAFPDPYSGFQKNMMLLTGSVSIVLLAFFFGTALEVLKQIGWSKAWKKQSPAWVRGRANQFEDRIFVSNERDTLHYFLKRPLNYDSTQLYPIVTCLHGGAIAVSGNVDIPEPAPFLIDTPNRKKFPAFIFVPQVSAGHTWGWLPGFPGMDSLVFGALAALQSEFSLDTNRYYLAGASGGGYGTWDYLSRRPHMFAAAIPICGVGNPATAARIAHIPVWAFHGEADRNVPVSGSRDMIAAMRAAGGNPKYSEFRSVGHNVWPEVQHTPGVLDWLFAQRRKD